MTLDIALAAVALSVALALRPWRATPAEGPPWPWLAWWAVMPLLWGADQIARIPLVQPIAGSCLLVMMAGWPLSVLAMVGVAALTGVVADLGWVESLSRLVWLGLVPATLTVVLGALIRRWLPHHLFVYILGRGFFASLLAMSMAGLLAWLVQGPPAGVQAEDLLLGRWLSAWADAFLTGMMVAIFVAFRPQWLATYSDALYLPR
ncbi:hypothetical protein [Ideonella paludis]|uniref:Uncharacterized protein n=1 Tax=Ideonella paludis TaxID=1233411 RepID=A0ABS5DVW2_9BURK|nr:hypothetical protein [Ideonella paludis]MBQ0935291.1 hypothetical protein [Ideonella paludis]